MTTNSRAQLWTACLGNLFEHYDSALFGFLSPFLAPLIFPEQDPITALILTYAIIPLGMFARPIGALVFGYIGDVYGRGCSLFFTLAGMALVSGFIALTPTYAQAGILAPILFCLGKALQNFLVAGETMGGAIFILENTPQKRHDLLSSLYSSSAMGGHLLASIGVYLISQYYDIDPGWRLLYLCGCITAIFGCMIRATSFTVQASEKFLKTVDNLKNTIWTHRKALFVIVVSSGFAQATYTIALVLMNGLIPLISSITKAEVTKLSTYLLIFDFCAFPFFGWIASKISREKFMLTICLGSILLSTPLLTALQGASFFGIVAIRTAFVIFGVAFFAPFHAWTQQLVPPNCRYAILSLGYALGTQLFGSPTAPISLWCYKQTGMISSVAWYWILLGLASSLSIMITMRAKNRSEIKEQIP